MSAKRGLAKVLDELRSEQRYAMTRMNDGRDAAAFFQGYRSGLGYAIRTINDMRRPAPTPRRRK